MEIKYKGMVKLEMVISEKRKMTTDKLKNKIFELVGNEYELIGEYINYKTKVYIRHNKCGCIYDVKYTNFMNGRRCPKCFGTPKKKPELFKKEVYDLVGNEYTVLGEYISTQVKVKMRHSICENEYEVVPNSFLRGARCSQCFGNKKKTTELYKKEVFDLVKNDYTVIGEYFGQSVKIKMMHNICGFVYDTLPNNFLLNNRRCPDCNGGIKLTQEQFENKFYSLSGEEYELKNIYINCNTKVAILHKKCGNIFEMLSGNFFKGQRCPQCSESKGEQKIRIFLENKGINFQREYSFSDCKYKITLPFDFVIFNINQYQLLAIEFDGKHHYEPVRFGGISLELAEKAFVQQQKHDKIKTNYCKLNNISLVRIPYTKFDNIEEILTFALIKLNINIAI